ncbi:MAG: hypothetical protein V3U24_04985 [Candidatus Neomarinimicrobiota bacterium]
MSVVHALIPNHWIPLVAIGRAEKWTRTETLGVTAMAGFAHTASTILIGIVIGLMGYRLSSSYAFITHIVAPIILVGLGSVYLMIDVKDSHLKHHLEVNQVGSRRSKSAIITSLTMAMFFSPCIEIEAYYFFASSLGWLGIMTVTAVYLVTTVLGMVLLVNSALKGIEKLKWNFLEHREKRVTGLILILLGVFAYLVNI